MLPLIAVAGAIAAVDAIAADVVDVGVAVEVVVHVDVDIAAAPGSADRDTYAKTDRRSCPRCPGTVVRWIVDRWIRISRRTVNSSRFI